MSKPEGIIHLHGREEPEEAWLPVPGFSGYEVSSEGRVRSWVYPTPQGTQRRSEPKILRPGAAKAYGHRLVMLGRGNPRYVHQLVLEAFLGPAPEGYTGSHLNGDTADNRLVNLAWETMAQNNRRQLAHGTRARGERNGHAKLSADTVRQIRARYTGDPKEILTMAAEHGVHDNTVRDIVKRRIWRHV